MARSRNRHVTRADRTAGAAYSPMSFGTGDTTLLLAAVLQVGLLRTEHEHQPEAKAERGADGDAEPSSRGRMANATKHTTKTAASGAQEVADASERESGHAGN